MTSSRIGCRRVGCTGGTRWIMSTPRTRPGAGCGGAPSSNLGCGVHRHRRGARRPPCCEPRREASAACRIVIVQTFAQRESGRSIGEVGIDQFSGSSPVTVSVLVDAGGRERAGASRPTRGYHREPPDSASASILSNGGRRGRRRRSPKSRARNPTVTT